MRKLQSVATMKQELESIHFLRQLQRAKKLSLELAKKQRQVISPSPSPTDAKTTQNLDAEPAGDGDAKASDSAAKTLLKTRSPVRRRSVGNSSRHSRSSRRFVLNSSMSPNHKSPSRPPSKEPSPQRALVGLQKFVEVETDGHHGRINVFDQIEIVTPDELSGVRGLEKEESEKENTPKKSSSLSPKHTSRNGEVPVTASSANLHQPSFRVLNEHVSASTEAMTRTDGYYRYIEKTAEELEEEVEYEMDCEDLVWFRLYNEHRHKSKHPLVAEDTFEMLMDRLEKEAHAVSQSQRNVSTNRTDENDDDVVCNICLDGDCPNTNVILFCDRCNLAVHQECYGVPFVPEGQWLCSRCQSAPAGPVNCVLCPVTDGAMKQTNRGLWSHILCALWIPEVGFGSIESLEPITKIEKVPPARRRLTCSVCKQKGIGACIQCMRKNCFTAFHVTCAQQSGIYMTIEPTHNEDGSLSNVRKTLLCNRHKPANARPFQPMYDSSGMETDEDRPLVKSRSKASEPRKRGRGSPVRVQATVDSKPVKDDVQLIPKHRLVSIVETVKMKDRDAVLHAILCYWSMKRKARNGIPLLRRLQASSLIHALGIFGDNDNESVAGLKDLKKLRHEMEKVRLLLELVRKREKLKLELIKLRQKSFRMELEPLNELLRFTLDELQARDRSNIFAFPVPLKELPDYASKIKSPMDFFTMKSKIDRHAYRSFDEFVADFDRIINNCMAYNAKHTLYHKAALRLRQQTEEILDDARRMVDQIGFNSSGLHESTTVDAQTKTRERRRSSAAADLMKPTSVPAAIEDRRSSDRVKMPTRRYLIDDEVAPAMLSASSRKRKTSTDSEGPPVLSRCPSPVDGISHPCASRKRARLGSKDPPQLVKSSLCVESSVDSSCDSKDNDDFKKSGNSADEESVPLASCARKNSSNFPAGNAVILAASTTVPPVNFQESDPSVDERGLPCASGEPSLGSQKSSLDFEQRMTIDLPETLSEALENDGSNSLPGNLISSSESYLKSLENLKVDSAYSSASCSSSDSDNYDKR